MKLLCPACKKVIKRDGRVKMTKLMTTKRGYKSWCTTHEKTTYLRRLK